MPSVVVAIGIILLLVLIMELNMLVSFIIVSFVVALLLGMTLVAKFGEKNIQWAVVIALFFEVGLVLLIPIVFAILRQLRFSILHLGIPMIAALSVIHGFLPPHSGSTVIAGEYGADLYENRETNGGFRNHLKRQATLRHMENKKNFISTGHQASASVFSQPCCRFF